MLRWLAEAIYERILRVEIDETPDHVAVIQDGNRRYARERGEEPSKGHVYGAETTEALLDWASEFGIEEVTLYTFSTENFDRPDDELEELFDLIEEKLEELAEDERVHEEEIRIRAIGDLDALPARVLDALDAAEQATEGYDGYRLNLALGYGGREELLAATRTILDDVRRGDLAPDDITERTVTDRLYTDDAETVDLVIRTGGDERLSNFLPWQAKGNESTVYFCAPYWPAFRKIDFMRAIRTYAHRERRRERRDADRALALAGAIGREELGPVLDRLPGDAGSDAEHARADLEGDD